MPVLRAPRERPDPGPRDPPSSWRRALVGEPGQRLQDVQSPQGGTHTGGGAHAAVATAAASSVDVRLPVPRLPAAPSGMAQVYPGQRTPRGPHLVLWSRRGAGLAASPLPLSARARAPFPAVSSSPSNAAGRAGNTTS